MKSLLTILVVAVALLMGATIAHSETRSRFARSPLLRSVSTRLLLPFSPVCQFLSYSPKRADFRRQFAEIGTILRPFSGSLGVTRAWTAAGRAGNGRRR